MRGPLFVFIIAQGEGFVNRGIENGAVALTISIKQQKKRRTTKEAEKFE